MDKNNARITLWFNLNNTEEREAYNVLSQLGHKTHFVSKIIISFLRDCNIDIKTVTKEQLIFVLNNMDFIRQITSENNSIHKNTASSIQSSNEIEHVDENIFSGKNENKNIQKRNEKDDNISQDIEELIDPDILDGMNAFM